MVSIIAEIGQNHNGNMDIARRLIWKAKECGADYAKFQVYDADKLYKDSEWYESCKKAELTKDQVAMLKAECERVGIKFLASVFDVERVDWLEELGVKEYKVASRCIHDTELLNKLESTGKDLIISLGMLDGKELPEFPPEMKVRYMYCVSKYPAEFDDIDFKEMIIRDGFSDHTSDLRAAKEAIEYGVPLIERHFTLHKDMEGPDHKLSSNPEELYELCHYKNIKLSIIVRVHDADIITGLNSVIPYLNENTELIVFNSSGRELNLPKLNNIVELFADVDYITALNTSIIMANGDYIVAVDSDDYIFPHTIPTILSYIGDVDYLYGDYYEIRGDHKFLIQCKFFFDCIVGNVIIRRELINELGRYNRDFKLPEYELYHKLSKYKGKHIPIPIYNYVRRPDSLTGDSTWVREGLMELKEKYGKDFIFRAY